MRSKDPELMERICSYVGDYYRLKYSSPTVRAIAEGLDISKSTAHSYLVEMSKRGMISYQDGVISDLPKISKTKTGYFQLRWLAAYAAAIRNQRKPRSRCMSAFRKLCSVGEISIFFGRSETLWWMRISAKGIWF